MSVLRLIFVCFMVSLVLTATAHAVSPRTVMPLETGWQFLRAEVAGGEAVAFDTKDWQAVTLPHSYNGTDATSPDYYRGPAWYRLNLKVAALTADERAFVEFDAAALATDLWVNGQKAGRHEGGYARFRFDVTDFLKAGVNHLAVRTDNSKLDTIVPLGGDFTVFGGIYQPVRLVITKDVHLDMLDYGSSGVYVRTSEVSPVSAKVGWTVRIANDRASDAGADVTMRVFDADSRLVKTLTQTVALIAGKVTPVNLGVHLDQPRLWQGIDDPYLYRSEIEISVAGQVVDTSTVRFGLRDIRFDPDTGLWLNGKPYRAYGINVHHVQRPGKGPAVSAAEVAEDFKLIDDLGLNALRLAHYQHPQAIYDHADEKGYLIWTELPVNSVVTDAVMDNTKIQLKELIRQTMNHPSVMVWGIGNEVYKVDEASNALLSELHKLSTEEDASRPTVYAHCCGPANGPHARHSGVIGFNIYYGWYDHEVSEFAAWADNHHKVIPATPMSISEYGAGGSVKHQEDPPRRVVAPSRWHPEQYQNRFHETYWRTIRDRPYIWGSFIWLGFDFASAGRNEGDQRGINDKGLVTYDRKVRKDSYFWYQANWSKKPVLYITSRRYTQRVNAQAEVKVYSNLARARLKLNGADMGEASAVDHVLKWPQVMLARGRNRLEVIAQTEDGSLTDTVEWIYLPPEN